MANKAISELPQAQNVNNQDLFVLEQSGIAKKLTAETFITEQGIIDALAEALDGHGGIQSVTLSSVSGRIRTYLITFTDGSATTFQVYDGTTIERIAKTSTAGLVDTYTIFMNDGTTTFFTVTNGADGTVSEAMLNDALKDKAPAITETTESSAIANFTDGADDLVMHNVVAEINPVQSGSGDPSPSNIRPISGWTGCNVTRAGKNLFDAGAWLDDVGISYTVDSDGWYSINSVTGSNGSVFSVPYRLPSTITGSATLLLDTDGTTATNVRIRLYNGTLFVHEGIGGNPSRAVAENKSFDSVCFNFGSGGSIKFKCQVELGSSATAYEEYITPTTTTLSWQTEAGTVYGGTIDVATGLLTVDMAMVDMGTLNWTKSSVSRDNVMFVSMDLQSVIKAPPSTQDVTNAVSSAYAPTTAINALSTNNTNGTFAVNTHKTNPSANGQLYVVNNAYADATAFKTAMNGVQLCYELATPQTYQLTPQEVIKTLLGTNNVWADTGNVSVTYPADTKLYIEKLTMPTEDDLVANQAITSGKYFMIGNSLYLALANIASGAQITIGTNAQRVSLADALNTINS